MEYFSKNNLHKPLHKNLYYGGGGSGPPGCSYSGGTSYYFNPNTKSTTQCSPGYKCVCKIKTCIKCPINTYSNGGLNPTCTPCPKERPNTFLNRRDSIDSCTKVKDAITCKAGERVISGKIFTSGDASQVCGVSKITTEAECKSAAEYNRKNKIYITRNSGNSNIPIYNHGADWASDPPGCIYYHDNYYFNIPPGGSTVKCSNKAKCICKPKQCSRCPINTYNDKAGINPTCTPCPNDRPTTNFTTGQTSINACIPVPPIKCEAGYGFIPGNGITKRKQCIKCKPNTYSTGGMEVKCAPCPKERPTTNFKTGQTSIDACIPVPPIKCEAGYGFTIGNGITKRKQCIKCKANTYSTGGMDVKCTKCPKDRPFTKHNSSKHDSIASCVPLTCESGYGIKLTDIRVSGSQCSGISKMATEAECKLEAEYNSKNNIDKNRGYGGRWSGSKAPPGCVYNSDDNKYYFNVRTTSTTQCSNSYKCICNPRKTCTKCPINTYSEGGTNPKCEPCKPHHKAKVGSSKCVHEFSNEWVMYKFDSIDTIIDKTKETQNDLSIKNSRLWQKEKIRLQHDKLMQKRKKHDDRNEKSSCEKQRDQGTVIFPAIEISNEIEDNEDTTCIDTNRDELLKSFCSFRMDLDNLFQIQSIDKEAKSFWPNICCKERKDKTLEVCEDPNGRIKREDIIPFALSQGGDYSRHNLYAEVTDTIKQNGYLHKGMKKLLRSLGRHKTRNANKLVNSFFKEVSLCGPRIVESPRKNERKLCELFIPYHHAMKQFYKLIEKLYYQPLNVQQSSSFVQTMESALHQRQLSGKKRLGKNMNGNMQQIMQAKPGATKAKAEQQCNHEITSTKWTSDKLEQVKSTHCKGSNHLDLSNMDVKNIAIHYLKEDLRYDDKKMFSLKQALRYDIKDSSCAAAPLFTAKDISIQQVNMDTLGKEKEWVAVVNLNTKDENSYLQSELPYCKDRDYLIGAKVTVKAYIDNDGCCENLKDFTKCKAKVGCEDKLTNLKDKSNKDYSKDVVLTGTQYVVTSSHDDTRRRRLLQDRSKGDCRL